MKENADKARALDKAEINKQLHDAKEQMFRLRFQMSMGQMEGVRKVRSLRKERARMLTVLRERELADAKPAPAVVKTKPAAAKKG
jgi:large subunit ribosomal protein L29